MTQLHILRLPPRPRPPARRGRPRKDDPGPVILRAAPPVPERCFVGYTPTADGVATTVVRMWADGDEARCRLCAGCSAADGICIITFDGYIARDAAPTFDASGLRLCGPEAASSRGGCP